MSLKPEIEARVHFLDTGEGGKTRTIPAGIESYSIPLEFESRYFDCRFRPNVPQAINPGDTVDLAIQFLNPDLVLPRLRTGVDFRFWEGGTIAVGTVTKIG